MSQLCDMCGGTGEIEYKVTSHGDTIYASTGAGDWEAADMEWKKEGSKTAKFPCQICDGSGTLPAYLTPGYWEGRVDEARANKPIIVRVIETITGRKLY